MITKNDCLVLLAELSNKGIDTQDITKQLITQGISTDVLKFINKHRPMEIVDFYNKLRINYNKKKSKTYKEIVQIDKKQPKDILVTISSLLTQILLFSNNIEDRELFLKHSRASEISKVISNYFITYDVTLCIKLLNLIKADIKALESIKETI